MEQRPGRGSGSSGAAVVFAAFPWGAPVGWLFVGMTSLGRDHSVAAVKDILDKKGTNVLCIARDETVLRAAQVMNEHKVGALVVIDASRVAGIFTERDVLRRVVGEERAPATTRVEEVMTAEVACCSPQTPLEEARAAMMNKRIRHLPVLDGEGRLLGLVSIGDLNAFEAANHEETIFWLNEYLHGRGGTR